MTLVQQESTQLRRVRTTAIGWLSVTGACVTTLVIHALFLRRALGPDEGGFSVVARYWGHSGHYLYGPLWVDRPPGLLLVFDIANRLGPYGVRVLAAVTAMVIVLGVSRAARTIAGEGAARWAAWTAAAFASSAAIQANQLNGELIGAALLSLSCAAVLAALHSQPVAAGGLGAVAGALAGGAVFVKQNLLDAVVFAGVLLVATLLARRWTPSASATGVGLVGGGAAVLALAARWAVAHGGVAALAFAMYGFRARATDVMGAWSWTAPERRFWLLLLLAVGTLLVPVAVSAASPVRPRLRRLTPVGWAILATSAFELVSMIAGFNFWPHYLISFIPMVAIAAGVAASRAGRGARRTRVLVTAAIVGTAVLAVSVAAFMGSGRAWETGRWVGESSRPSDTIVVAYSHPNVAQASGLRPGYPYLWSLPARTLDPQLTLMTSALEGPTRATWFVRWDRYHNWGFDGHRQVGRALFAGYRRVGTVCGHQVWLRDDATRYIAPIPSPARCVGRAV
ncbi:MAG: hypothetical protein ACJ71Z_12400 [Aeromicrobium sp.]